MTIRVLLIEGNDLFRQGLCALLSAEPGFEVVGDLAGGKEALQLSLTLKPDIVLMDIMLAGMNGLEIVAQIKRRQPYVRVVMLTVFKTQDYVRETLRVGADGFVLKTASFEELLMALRSVAQGKKFLSPDVSVHVVDSFLHPEQAAAKASRLERLTTRERSVLQLVAEGRTNRRAAEFLSLSTKTVEKHRATLMRKLGLRNSAELIMVALEMGLIERPDVIEHLFAEANGSCVA